MATYKVIQDIEAEDKLLGPLTMRQLIYAFITLGLGFAVFQLMLTAWFLAIPLIFPTLLFAALALPLGRDQSSEVWLLAKIRFFLKPRKRIWDQSGLKDLVTITVPKKLERHLTDGLSQTEVRSRLEALANTIDSRGWAIKNVNVNLFSQPSYVLNQAGSDRLIDPNTMAQDVQNFDIRADDDMFEMSSSSTAQHFSQLIDQSTQAHRQQVIQKMHQDPSAPATTPDYWFLHQSAQGTVPAGYASGDNTQVVNPGAAPANITTDLSPSEEAALLDKIHKEQEKPKQAGNLKTILPLSEQKEAAKHKVATPKNTASKPKKEAAEQPAAPVPPKAQEASPAPASPAILELANRNDLDVATIARQAEKAKPKPPDEVVVSLR